MSLQSYLNLVTAEHADKPNFLAVLAAILQPMVDEEAVLAAMPPGYDLDMAIGSQLDVVGQWVGLSRKLRTPIAGVYFSFNTLGVGFGQGVWKGPFDPTDGVISLDDDTYRLMLYAKVVANTWDGTLEELTTILQNVFVSSPGTFVFVQDNMDMSLTIGLSGTIPSVLFQQLLKQDYLVFRPAAVLLKGVYVVSVDNTPMFGFNVNNAYIAGFGTGSWAKKL